VGKLGDRSGANHPGGKAAAGTLSVAVGAATFGYGLIAFIRALKSLGEALVNARRAVKSVTANLAPDSRRWKGSCRGKRGIR